MDEIIVSGYVPVSLMDFPGKIAAVVFLHGCNLRCRYCHNPELVTGRPPVNALDDFISYLQGSELEGVAVTGGEPLFSCGLDTFLSQIKGMGYDVKLDTNGFLPSRLKRVLAAGLADFVSVDVKAFNSEDVRHITRREMGSERFYKTVEVLHDFGVSFELRHTLWKMPDAQDVQSLMEKCAAEKITVQFPARYGHWLDKRFDSSFSREEAENIKAIFDRYDVTYRNMPE